jgi:hypothetical protein
MDRREFVSGVAFGLLAEPLPAEAQQAGKAPRIGYVSTNLAASPQLSEAFRQGLRELGYVEARNVVIEWRSAEGKLERLPALAAELVALKVDVIVAGGTPQALAAKQATRTVPIVFAAAGDPITSRLVTSLARLGGNHGVVRPRPGTSRQVSGTPQAGRAGGQSGRGPLAARYLPRTHGKGHAEGSRSRGAGAEGAASIR